MRKLLLYFLCLSFASNGWATVIKDVTDEGTVTATISALDVTRLVISGDRIQSLKGVQGTYTHENDERNGEVYLQPQPLYQHAAFTILIETELGRHFTVLLTPASVPGGTLMLIPKGVGRAQAAHFERASDYQVMLTYLISDMANGVVPEGFSRSTVNQSTRSFLDKKATLHLITVYQGLHFQGQVYELTNKTGYPIELDERRFFNNKTAAISLEKTVSFPHGTINVFRVVRHD